MHKTGFLYDDIFLKHEMPPGHPERKERLTAILAGLEHAPFRNDLLHIPPRKASFEDISRVHTAPYIEKIKRFGSGYLDGDTFMSENSLEAALHAAGAVMEAVDRCKSGEIERAFCAVRPPGHHAEAGRAMGFCIFNNVAVGARYAQKIGYKKIFIIDFDVHHGNGTQHIFEEDDTVFYFSTHQIPLYPGTGYPEERGRGKGEGYTYNVPMPPGSGDKEFYAVYSEILPPLMEPFRPDIVLVSAGYDIHVNDPLASLQVTGEGLRNIVHNIVCCPLESGPVPFVFTLEGGYNLSALSEGVSITIEELLK
ncbi:MAG: histone deacetylase [Nitrospirota bacterium]